MNQASMAAPASGGMDAKPFLTPVAVAQQLTRTGATWTKGNHDALSNGTLTFGFWSNYAALAGSYYTDSSGTMLLPEVGDEADFLPITDDQKKSIVDAIRAWDDIIALRIFPAIDIAKAAITFGNAVIDASAAAYTYLPYGDKAYADLKDIGFDDAYRLGGDVWINQDSPTNFEALFPGGYGAFTILHEIGHALGLAHPGDYNAGNDRDGDGVADALSYAADAAFYQDSQKYTIMSYFDERQTGASWLDWQTRTFLSAMTPMVDDIVAIQALYGADRTTRTGATTYGFNSTADNPLYDFDQTPAPVLTIWDAGGRDTLDLSGFSTDEVINLNQGAYSSASAGVTLADLKGMGVVPSRYTQSQLDALFAQYGSGPQGQMKDNIAIAYGTVIENAIAGSGNDLLIANEVANVLRGNEGVDTVSYRDSKAGVTASLATNRGTGGDAAGDRYIDIERLEGSGFADHLTGGNRDDMLTGLQGDDVLNGGNGADTLLGGMGNDLLDGGNGNDRLYGDAGDDVLRGGRGDDSLSAGTGIDEMTGGDGRDSFLLDAVTTTLTITDFQSRYDRIDLRGIDANPDTTTWDAFAWIGNKAFTGQAGELRTYVADDITYLAADLDGDRVADLLLSLRYATITASDLILA